MNDMSWTESFLLLGEDNTGPSLQETSGFARW